MSHNEVGHMTALGTWQSRAHDSQGKGRSIKSRVRRIFNLHPTYLRLWAE
jgi:hypothetical protein